MTRLPPAMQPLWPLAKRVHRGATKTLGQLNRATGLGGDRAVPASAYLSSVEAAAVEPDAVRLHVGGSGEVLRRRHPMGTPPHLRFWDDVVDLDVPPRSVLEVDDGILVGDYAATITPAGVLDFQTSPYFGIRGWQEHPIYLRTRLPVPEQIEGTVLSLASHASGRNYYHSLMDTLPRWGMLQEAMPGTTPDRIVVSARSRWDQQLIAMVGLDQFELIEPAKNLSLQAERLLVPGLNNQETLAPEWITRWLRTALPPRDVHDKPKRLYVTRGTVANTRRLVRESELMPALERLGFVRFDPGAASVQEQIDHFAAAEVVVAPHGAGLVNLNFAPEGVKVLELFAPRYLNPGFWAITNNVADSTYRYLVACPVETDRRADQMQAVQADIQLTPEEVLAGVEELLAL